MDLGQIAAALSIIAILAGFVTWLIKQHPRQRMRDFRVWRILHQPIRGYQWEELSKTLRMYEAKQAGLRQALSDTNARITQLEARFEEHEKVDAGSRDTQTFLGEEIAKLRSDITDIQLQHAPVGDPDRMRSLQRMVEEQQTARNKPLKDPPRF